jgi:hypothetical protein
MGVKDGGRIAQGGGDLALHVTMSVEAARHSMAVTGPI